MKKTAMIIGFLLLVFCNKALAQKTLQVEIINANNFEYDENIGQKAKRLIGDVIFKQGNVLMYCDSAYFYSDINSLEAFGNVHIKQGDSVNVWGNLLKYNGNLKTAVLTNNVKLTDGEIVLTTSELFYDIGKNIAHYLTGGKIVNKENTLTSSLGYYYANQKNLYFKKNVLLVNPKYTMACDTLRYNTFNKTAYFLSPTHIKGQDNYIYCENGWYDTKFDKAEVFQNSYLENKEKRIKGDNLFYDRKNGIGRATQNVTLIDTTQRLMVSGNYGELYEKQGRAFVTGNAVLTYVIDKDTLFLHADTLLAINDTLARTKTLYAYQKVKFFMEQMQGLADSLVYVYSDSTIMLFGSPILWIDENQITADTIIIEMKDGKFNKLRTLENSFIISQLDSLKFNQIKGRRMTILFRDNDIHRLEVEDEGVTLYYPEDSKTKSYIGLNKVESEHMTIYFGEKSKVNRLVFVKDPEAVLIPLKQVKDSDYRLDNFNWWFTHRPQFARDIFDWKPVVKAANN